MGPLVYTSGNAVDEHPVVRPLVASMGPLVYTSGNHCLESSAVGRHRTASMGPLVYTSGNSASLASGSDRSGSFNGAAGLHQRKLVGVAVDGVDVDPLQWGRWFTPAETPTATARNHNRASFNGAAGLHQRKRSGNGETHSP